ncbi:Tyrosinase [Dactylella cylindrospora]|nr:Tyrosinase [Dactylella cylindrospora]
MQLHFLTILVAAISAVEAFKPASTKGTDKLAAKGLVNMAVYSVLHPPKSGCNLSKAKLRKEWGTLSTREKKDYIRAVLCLQSKPAKSGSLAPGAQSRFDDFVATHINQTFVIHATGNFLSWHRYYTWVYEKALREECGYKGYQPYINWGKYSHDLEHAPLFDGSDTSIGGNGEYIPRASGPVFPDPVNPTIILPEGKGSGCVTTGPFKNMTVNLGPGIFGAQYPEIPFNPQFDGLGYNPRCLRRDIGFQAARMSSNDWNSTYLINNFNEIGAFQDFMQGTFLRGGLELGVHTAGHFWVGGDPGGDFSASPGDPYFYLHHAQIDRTWWIWQNQDPKVRYKAVGGTITILNTPPSRNATLDDPLDLGINAPVITIGDALSTIDGPFCYIYV